MYSKILVQLKVSRNKDVLAMSSWLWMQALHWQMGWTRRDREQDSKATLQWLPRHSKEEQTGDLQQKYSGGPKQHEKIGLLRDNVIQIFQRTGKHCKIYTEMCVSCALLSPFWLIAITFHSMHQYPDCWGFLVIQILPCHSYRVYSN